MISTDNLKTPPHSLELERNAIGTILLQSQQLDTLDAGIYPELFYTYHFELICKAIMELQQKNEAINIMSVSECMRANNTLDKIGGVAKLSELCNTTEFSMQLKNIVKLLWQYYLRRKTIEINLLAIQKAYEDSEDCFDNIQQQQTALMDLELGINQADIQHIKDMKDAAIEEIYRTIENHKLQRLNGIPTFSDTINEKSGGFIKGGLSIIAGPPGGGKTATLLQSAIQQLKEGYKVGIVSLEMSKVLLIKRLISNLAKINGYKLRDGNLTEQEFEQSVNELTKLCETDLYIADNVYIKLNDLRAVIRKMYRNGCDIVYIDYLQLIKTDNPFEKEHQLNENITQTIQKISREFNIPIVLLSQLSRQHNKKPTMESLRGGGIEQASDLIIILYDENPEENKDKSEVDITAIIAKAKHGSTGDVDIHFDKKYQIITDGWKVAQPWTPHPSNGVVSTDSNKDLF